MTRETWQRLVRERGGDVIHDAPIPADGGDMLDRAAAQLFAARHKVVVAHPVDGRGRITSRNVSPEACYDELATALWGKLLDDEEAEV